MSEKICVGVIGSGIISEIYLKNMTTRFPKLWVKAVAYHVMEVLTGILESGKAGRFVRIHSDFLMPPSLRG